MTKIMPNNDVVLSLYKTVAQITEQMLHAAQIGDWDQLVVLESRCSAHVGELMQQEPLGLPSAVGRAAEVRFIQKILDADRQIRDLVQPWMVHLGAMIKTDPLVPSCKSFALHTHIARIHITHTHYTHYTHYTHITHTLHTHYITET